MKRIFTLLMLGALLLFVGCGEKTEHYKYAGLDENLSLENVDDALVGRILKYWDARSRHDFKTTYEIELPYDRFLKSWKVYEAEGRSLYEGFYTKITDIKTDGMDPRISWVTREYMYDDKHLRMRSKWIRVNGVWYHKYDFSVFPQTKPLR